MPPPNLKCPTAGACAARFERLKNSIASTSFNRILLAGFMMFLVSGIVRSISSRAGPSNLQPDEEIVPMPVNGLELKVVVQNLQKTPGLATKLAHRFDPDVLLVQEISLSTEDPSLFESHYTSKRAQYGTAIGCTQGSAKNVKQIRSPVAEVGGFIYKKTTIATVKGVQFISFHGYNGQPGFTRTEYLEDHVQAVVSVLSPDRPALFAGDFNTWTRDHLAVVEACLAKEGFQLAFSWPYPGREVPLDHAFTRGIRITNTSLYHNEADHRGAVLELVVV